LFINLVQKKLNSPPAVRRKTKNGSKEKFAPVAEIVHMHFPTSALPESG